MAGLPAERVLASCGAMLSEALQNVVATDARLQAAVAEQLAGHENAVGKLVMTAVAANDSGLVGRVLDAIADPNAINMGHSDLTPLQLASYGNRVQVCAYLIERGADVDLGPADWVRDGVPLTTPLAYASMSLSVPQLRLLLDAHANPNIRYRMDGGGIGGPLAL